MYADQLNGRYPLTELQYTPVNQLPGRILLCLTDIFEKIYPPQRHFFSSSYILNCILHNFYRLLGEKSCIDVLDKCFQREHVEMHAKSTYIFSVLEKV